jgi:hypothetical protein
VEGAIPCEGASTSRKILGLLGVGPLDRLCDPLGWQAQVIIRGADLAHGPQAQRTLDGTLFFGTDPYKDRIQYSFSTNVLVACDQSGTVDILVPGVGSLGLARGMWTWLASLS